MLMFLLSVIWKYMLWFHNTRRLRHIASTFLHERELIDTLAYLKTVLVLTSRLADLDLL